MAVDPHRVVLPRVLNRVLPQGGGGGGRCPLRAPGAWRAVVGARRAQDRPGARRPSWVPGAPRSGAGREAVVGPPPGPPLRSRGPVPRLRVGPTSSRAGRGLSPRRGRAGRAEPPASIFWAVLCGAAAGLAGPEAPWTPGEARRRRRSRACKCPSRGGARAGGEARPPDPLPGRGPAARPRHPGAGCRLADAGRRGDPAPAGARPGPRGRRRCGAAGGPASGGPAARLCRRAGAAEKCAAEGRGRGGSGPTGSGTALTVVPPLPDCDSDPSPEPRGPGGFPWFRTKPLDLNGTRKGRALPPGACNLSLLLVQ